MAGSPERATPVRLAAAAEPAAAPVRSSAARGVLVLGMHRSGTSAVAGLFASAGFDPGEPDGQLPAGPDNPSGYFERLSVVHLNEELLARAGGGWSCPPAGESVRSLREEYLPRASGLLADLHAAAAGRPIVLKDPRLCVLLPVWLPATSADLTVVLTTRNPVETARSLRVRDGLPLPVALALWEVYVAAMLADLNGMLVHVAPYETLLSDHDQARALVAGVAETLSRPSVGEPDTGFLDEALRRNRSEPIDLREILTSHQLAVWEYLSTLRAGPQLLDVPAEQRQPTAPSLALLREHDQLARRALLGDTVPGLEAAVSELRDQVADLTERLTAAGEERAQQAAEIAALRDEVVARDDELRLIRSSRSWRVAQAVLRPAAAVRATVRRRGAAGADG
jgi:hypothetical protein